MKLFRYFLSRFAARFRTRDLVLFLFWVHVMSEQILLIIVKLLFVIIGCLLPDTNTLYSYIIDMVAIWECKYLKFFILLSRRSSIFEPILRNNSNVCWTKIEEF